MKRRYGSTQIIPPPKTILKKPGGRGDGRVLEMDKAASVWGRKFFWGRQEWRIQMNNNCIMKVFEKIVSIFCNNNGTKTKGDNSLITVTETKGDNSPINVTKGNDSPIITGNNNTKNKTSGPQSPVINGNNNTVVFNLNEPLTDKLLLAELSKLQYGDFEDITDNIKTDENDKNSYFSYTKNSCFSMRRKRVADTFYESWLNFIMPRDDPSVFEDEISFFYQGCFIKSFLIIVLDGGRFQMPLPKVFYVEDYDKSNGADEVVGLSDPVVKERCYPLDNHPVEKIVLTEIELTLSKALSCYNHENYLQALRKRNKLEISKE
ncbi:MAG: hypothetical protein LBL19_04190 [Spirochaetaceae bacterium]|jgi:hypothetical protein|nr:hypothetical protein [Spirochaetaceae bacterium]